MEFAPWLTGTLYSISYSYLSGVCINDCDWSGYNRSRWQINWWHLVGSIRNRRWFWLVIKRRLCNQMVI